MRGKVTKRGVDKLEPDGNAEAVLWDTELKGFGIRARSGGSKSYILHYRAGAGRTAPLRKRIVTLAAPAVGSPVTLSLCELTYLSEAPVADALTLPPLPRRDFDTDRLLLSVTELTARL